MKTYKQFIEGLEHISGPLKKIKDSLKKRTGGQDPYGDDKPYTQEPGGPIKKV